MNNNILDPVIRKVPETPYEHACTMIHRYYYALPNNGYADYGINSCESRYREGIKCALIAIEDIISELEFIIIKMTGTGNELEEYIMEKINFGDQIKTELIKIQANKDKEIEDRNNMKTDGGDMNGGEIIVTDDNPGVIVDKRTTGETTIQFPKPYQPEQYNPNKPSLDTMTFKFEQDSNCVDGGEGETLIVEAKSSLGIDGDGGAFYVLKTEQWAISDIDDIIQTLERVKVALDATKPTSIHVK